ncbi:MAG: preprotein translocase subunit SecY, partial [bacterium]
MLKAFLNSLKIPEVRNKLLFTFGLLAVYRIGSRIVIPGVDPIAVEELGSQGGLLELADMFSGGAFSQFAVFALGIMPYISASIIMQLLTAVIPALEELKKEGQQGQKKINQYTRFLTVLIATVQGLGMTIRSVQVGVAPSTAMFYFISVLSLVTGAVFVMWLGEQITEYGIGNGISLLIYVSIISSIPRLFVDTYRLWKVGEFDILAMIALFGLLLGLFVVCVWIQTAERRVPVKYARQVRGRKVYGGQASHLPLKVDYSGVIAVIFASSVMLFPVLIFQFAVGDPAESGWLATLTDWLQRGGFLWAIIYTSLIIVFCYVYTAISFNPSDVADNLKRSGGFIPGRRPG